MKMTAQPTPQKYDGNLYVLSRHPDRWDNVTRPFSPDQVQRLRPVVANDPTIARYTAERFWELLKRNEGVRGFGVDNPVEAVNAVRGGNEVAYLSGWMVAANANDQVLPDMGLYGDRDGSILVRRLNAAFDGAAKVDRLAYGEDSIDWCVPIVADIEAGFGGINNVHELTRDMIYAGVASVHIEDQDPSSKRCGHMAGKAVIPTSTFIDKLVATRLTADIYGTPTVIIARTDTLAAKFIVGYTNDMEETDGKYIRSSGMDGRFEFGDPQGQGHNLEAAIARGRAYAKYADVLWMETGTPDLGVALEFLQGVREEAPWAEFTYNMSPSFNWAANLSNREIDEFADKLVEMGYCYPFSTLPEWRQKGVTAFEDAERFNTPGDGMGFLRDIQAREKRAESRGYKGTNHQTAVGSEFFDNFGTAVQGDRMKNAAGGSESTEHQFKDN